MEFNNTINYMVSYRDIKFPRVELKTGKPLFVLPFGCNPDIFFKKHKSWIINKINFIEECIDNAKNKELIERTDEEVKKLVCNILGKLSGDLEIKINQVYFRKMRTKWASLSLAGNLTTNKIMKYLPDHLIEYIIFHELVHVAEKKHNNRFWEIISSKYKDYKKSEEELFEYWFKVSEKLGM